MIIYVENPHPDWTPLQSPVVQSLHPAWRGFAPGSGSPPRRTRHGAPPATHELRPHERYYWVEGDLPAPPLPDDPRWAKVRLFLLDTVNPQNPLEPRLKQFTEDVWKAQAGSEQMSLGSWQWGFNENYWHPAWADECPEWRRVGWEPWADGHAGGNHYRCLTWCLENFMRTQDPLAWEQFVIGTLHLAGQGMNWSTGGLYNEKSPWWQAGDYVVGGTSTPWSHRWGEAIHLLSLLTGELADASQKIAEYAWYNPAYSSGTWGIRSTAWYLNEALAIDALLPDYVTFDDARAFDVIDRALAIPEQRGIHYFPNDGSGGIDVWQDWVMLEKCMHWGVMKGQADDIYNRCLPIADFHLAQHRNEHGQVAYYQHPNDGVVYRGFLHTSCALPFMAEMVRRGDMTQADLRKSTEFVLENLPYTTEDRNVYGQHRAGRGLLWVRRPDDPNDEGTRPWGGAASKIAANVMEGLRGDVLAMAGY